MLALRLASSDSHHAHFRVSCFADCHCGATQNHSQIFQNNWFGQVFVGSRDASAVLRTGWRRRDDFGGSFING